MPRRLPIAPALTIAVAVGIVLAERRWPLRRPTQAEPGRSLRNLALGTAALAVVQFAETPVVRPLARRVARHQWGVAQRLPLPAWGRDLAAILLLDYGIYLWHVLTHKVPLLWRFHLVHHVDLDLDASTALRFHAADMAISTPYRALQVLLAGAGPRALAIWQSFFFLSVLFHHSNLRLPHRLERTLSRVLTTPRMHGIHHAASRDQTDSNWSSGLSIWDHLHHTFRWNVPPPADGIGVPAYRDPVGVAASLAMPFTAARDAWTNPASTANRTSRAHHAGPMSSHVIPVS